MGAGWRKEALTDRLARKAPLLWADPRDVVIVEDTDSALFDERATLPIEDAHVQSVLHYTVIEPIICRRRGERIEVIDGRQRVRWARAANEILESRGALPMRVPVLFHDVTDREAVGVAVTLNEIRAAEPVIVKARRARRMSDQGYSQSEIGRAFGVSHATISLWLSMTRIAPELQRAAENGELRLQDAVRLAKLPPEEQVARFLALKRDAPTQAAQKHAGNAAERLDVPASQQRSSAWRLRRLAIFVVHHPEVLPPPGVSRVLLWLLGEIDDAALLATFPGLAPLMERP